MRFRKLSNNSCPLHRFAYAQARGAFWRPSLNFALTNSANRTVINSTIASTSQL
jgi:hypothetical protein